MVAGFDNLLSYCQENNSSKFNQIFFIAEPNLLNQLFMKLYQASDQKVAGSMPELGITSSCPWERHLTLIS